MARTVLSRCSATRCAAYAEILRDLNAAFRKTVLVAEMRLTPGVLALPEDERTALIECVRSSDTQPEGGPHDLGNSGWFWRDGRFCSWLIIDYALDMQSRSPDPADPAVTRRVLIVDSTTDRG